MAIQYAHSEDYDLSILQLKSALSDNPHFVKGYLLLALLYIGTDNYEKARVTLRRVLKIDKGEFPCGALSAGDGRYRGKHH